VLLPAGAIYCGTRRNAIELSNVLRIYSDGSAKNRKRNLCLSAVRLSIASPKGRALSPRFGKELAQAGISQRAIENLTRLRASSTPQRELEKLERLRIRVITLKDKTYPPLLREIEDPPPVLYTYGKLTEADQFALAVVGTRNSTTYGRQVTEQIVTDLAKGQVTVVSGLALGIDTIAHAAALDAGGRTIAVLACGLDIIYPPVNRGLARRIVESGQGALVTEYPLGIQPEGRNFPARNLTVS
jgi:DNA processing protein